VLLLLLALVLSLLVCVRADVSPAPGYQRWPFLAGLGCAGAVAMGAIAGAFVK